MRVTLFWAGHRRRAYLDMGTGFACRDEDATLVRELRDGCRRGDTSLRTGKRAPPPKCVVDETIRVCVLRAVRKSTLLSIR